MDNDDPDRLSKSINSYSRSVTTTDNYFDQVNPLGPSGQATPTGNDHLRQNCLNLTRKAQAAPSPLARNLTV